MNVSAPIGTTPEFDAHPANTNGSKQKMYFIAAPYDDKQIALIMSLAMTIGYC